jgi:hypothetical protein
MNANKRQTHFTPINRAPEDKALLEGKEREALLKEKESEERFLANYYNPRKPWSADHSTKTNWTWFTDRLLDTPQEAQKGGKNKKRLEAKKT